jgi:hypothetical protein
MALSFVKIVQEAKKVILVWKRNPSFALKGLAVAEIEDDVARLETLEAEILEKQQELTALVDERSDRGYFGPDSAEYEQAGGTRQSEQGR